MIESSRLQNILLASIRKIFEKAKILENQDRKIIHLEIGRPDFDTPKPVKEAAPQALKEGFVHCTSNYGMDELREVVAEKLRRENDIGASMALATAVLCLVERGQEVLVPDPFYPAYRKQVKLADCVFVRLAFTRTAAKLEETLNRFTETFTDILKGDD